MSSASLNLFRVLGVHYEVFHSRMLKWLWTPDAEHGADNRFLQKFLQAINLQCGEAVTLESERKVTVPGANRWRLADVVIRTPTHFILVENKVDPGYQDVLQVHDEVSGGALMAAEEGRQFVFVLIAPGPISIEIETEIKPVGFFLSWQTIVQQIRSTDLDGVNPFIQETIAQYAEFMDRPAAVKSVPAATDAVVADAETGIQQLLTELEIGATITAVDLWVQFNDRFPDHMAALEGRYADALNYSAKSWFSAKLQRLAAKRQQIEESGEWQRVDLKTWGYPKVQVYRRVAV